MNRVKLIFVPVLLIIMSTQLINIKKPPCRGKQNPHSSSRTEILPPVGGGLGGASSKTTRRRTKIIKIHGNNQILPEAG